MLGLPLYASIQKTIKNSGDEMQAKTKNIVGPWLLRRMCLTQRPWSINTYLLPKLYHRCHIIPLRVCDSTEIKKQVNRFLFCDQLEKPGQVLQYRTRSDGGLQVHNIEYKARALLIRSFLEIALIDTFQHFPLHEAVFTYYVLEDVSAAKPYLPKCYNQEFIATIKKAIDMGHNIEKMTSKDWYLFILNLNLLEEEKREVDGTTSRIKVRCKSEVHHQTLEWGQIWDKARMRGLSNDSRTFLWRLLNNLLPTEERLHIMHKAPSSICKVCDKNEVDNIWNHTFVSCPFTQPAMEWMIGWLKCFDPDTTIEKIIFLQISTNDALPCVWIIAESLLFIWSKRRTKTEIRLDLLKAQLKAKCEMLKKTDLFKEHATKMLQFLPQ